MNFSFRIVVVFCFCYYNTAKVFGQREIIGRILNAETFQPIKDVRIEFDGLSETILSDSYGFFKVKITDQVKELEISHVAYSTYKVSLDSTINTYKIFLKRKRENFVIDLTEYPKNISSNQTEKEITEQLTSKALATKNAYFHGGVDAFLSQFGNSFEYPYLEFIIKQSGIIRLDFTIDKQGNYAEVDCDPSDRKKLCSEFIRVLSILPKWNPALQQNNPVSQDFSLVIKYGPNEYWTSKLLHQLDSALEIRQLIGRVVDENQKPIKNANISILGMDKLTISNHLGYFEVSINPVRHKFLVVSHIGYKTAFVSIPQANGFKFSLEKEYVLLDRINLKNPEGNFRDLGEKRTPESTPIASEMDARYEGNIHQLYAELGQRLSELPQLLDYGNFELFFTIDEKGHVVNVDSNIEVDEIVKVANNVLVNLGKWEPAKQHGFVVPQYIKWPVLNKNTSFSDLNSLDEFYQYIRNTIRYPSEARRMGIEGAVICQFKTDLDGNIYDVKLLKRLGSGSDEIVKKLY